MSISQEITVIGSQVVRSRYSLRTRLIAWNVFTLMLLLGILGVVSLYMVRSFMMDAVDAELALRAHRLMGPGPGRPFGPGPMGGMGWLMAQRGMGPDRGSMEGPGPMGQGPGMGMGPGQPGTGPGMGSGMGMGMGMGPGQPGTGPGGGDNAREMQPPRFFDPSGSPLDLTHGLPPWDTRAIPQAAAGEAIYSTCVSDDKAYRVLSVGLPRPDGERIVAQIAEPLNAVNQALAGLLRALLAMIPVGLIFAAIGGALLTDRALRPVRRIAHAAARVSAEDLSLRLPVAGADEFAEMSGTFNAMLDRIQHAFAAQQGMVEELTRRVERERRFTADVSHELRTPITIVKANADLLANGDTDIEGRMQSIEDIEQAADRMSRLVQDLLLLARADVGQLARNCIVAPVREVVDRAVNGLVGHAHAPVRVDISDPALCVIGDEDEMVRLVGNLLENAARYTPADGAISVGAERTNGSVILRVTDTGMGIPSEHIPHLGERFYRVASDRSRESGGSGLGLSICKGIAEAHHGSIMFESVIGKGTRVTVVLPAAPRAESPGPDDDASEE